MRTALTHGDHDGRVADVGPENVSDGDKTMDQRTAIRVLVDAR
jgi:hypothetical protein